MQRTAQSMALVTLVLVLVLVPVGCTGQTPTSRRPANLPTATTPTPTPTRAAAVWPSTPGVPVTKAEAGRTLRDLPPIDGFKLRTFCLNGATKKCKMPTNPRWAQYVEWRGKRFHGRGRDASHDLVLLAVLAHKTPAKATDMLRDVRSRMVTGRIDEPTKDLPNNEYRLGRIGSGTVSRIAVGGWQGVTATSRVRLRYRGSRSRPAVVQVDTALRRGRYGVQVVAWMGRRKGQPDPAATIGC